MIPLSLITPEIILTIGASVLFLFGILPSTGARRVVPYVALLTLLVVFCYEGNSLLLSGNEVIDPTGTFRISAFSDYIKLLSSGVGVLFVLLAWPNNARATANNALSFGTEAGEFFALMLLSITGIFLVAGANDIILLFLGVELASIPTYIMVSVSRPLPAAQEAGVKYFFLGAMAAALMLFGFSYLYGATGTTNLSEISNRTAASVDRAHDISAIVHLSPWLMLGAVMVISGLSFKMASFPLHFYAADVYQGAATPVTALLSYVPKTSGFIALIKVLYALGGANFALPVQLSELLWILAVLTMTVGNVLGLLQMNVKRVLAYSSVAHSGYLLTGVAVLAASPNAEVQRDALRGILFYLAAYGIMNAGAFGVLMLLPARPSTRRYGETLPPETPDLPAASAETYEDIAGSGRTHPTLGLAMAACCFSLIGLPLTIGFFGKFYLIQPALRGGNYWLVALTMLNAAIGAAYYLKIIATMFLRTEPASTDLIRNPATSEVVIPRSIPAWVAIFLSAVGSLAFGTILPATEGLQTIAGSASSAEVTQGTSNIPTFQTSASAVP